MVVLQQGTPALDAVEGYGEEKILGVVVLINEMAPSLLRRTAFTFAVFHET